MLPDAPFHIACVSAPPDPGPLAGLLRDYWEVIVPKLADLGGPSLDLDTLVADTLSGLPEYLPPNGRMFLATDPDGTLLGCGFLKRLTPDAGEMKRLFVRPQAQGTGLGRALVQARITAGREMGLRWLYADTLKGNTPMLRLYEQLGFHEVPRYPAHQNYPEVLNHIVYRGLQL